ncbi:hypothetical protein MHYP_G00315600, partial [Metynnis hypsauchen]
MAEESHKHFFNLICLLCVRRTISYMFRVSLLVEHNRKPVDLKHCSCFGCFVLSSDFFSKCKELFFFLVVKIIHGIQVYAINAAVEKCWNIPLLIFRSVETVFACYIDMWSIITGTTRLIKSVYCQSLQLCM